MCNLLLTGSAYPDRRLSEDEPGPATRLLPTESLV